MCCKPYIYVMDPSHILHKQNISHGYFEENKHGNFGHIHWPWIYSNCQIVVTKVGIPRDIWVQNTHTFKPHRVCFFSITFHAMNGFWWDLVHIRPGKKIQKRNILVMSKGLWYFIDAISENIDHCTTLKGKHQDYFDWA